MESRSAFFKAVVIVLAAVEIDSELSHSGNISLGQNKRTVALPVSHVNRMSEDRRQQLPERRTGAGRGVELLGRLSHQRGALRAHGRKHFWMCKRETESAIATHRDAADRSILTARADPIFALDIGDELLQKKIAVAYRTIR